MEFPLCSSSRSHHPCTPALLVAALVGVAAADSSPPPLRLADVVAQARRDNPELRATRERGGAARFVPARIAAYEDPTIGYEAWNAPESFRVGRADNQIVTLAQRIPFPGKRTTAATSASLDADATDATTAAKELDVVAAAERAYYDLWQAEREREVVTRERDVVVRVAALARERYALGLVEQTDVLRAALERTRLETRVATQALAIDEARAELNGWLGRPASDDPGRPADPPPAGLDAAEEALTARALANRPELAAARAMAARARSGVRLAELDFLPDFEVSLSRFVNDRRRDGVGLSAALTLPLVNRARYEAAASEARAIAASAGSDLRALELRIAREVRVALLRACSARLRRDLLVSTHVPQAEQALATSESAYRTGRLDSLMLLESLRTSEAVHLEHVAAEADLGRALADLERAVGAPLEQGDAR